MSKKARQKLEPGASSERNLPAQIGSLPPLACPKRRGAHAARHGRAARRVARVIYLLAPRQPRDASIEPVARLRRGRRRAPTGADSLRLPSPAPAVLAIAHPSPSRHILTPPSTPRPRSFVTVARRATSAVRARPRPFRRQPRGEFRGARAAHAPPRGPHRVSAAARGAGKPRGPPGRRSAARRRASQRARRRVGA